MNYGYDNGGIGDISKDRSGLLTLLFYFIMQTCTNEHDDTSASSVVLEHVLGISAHIIALFQVPYALPNLPAQA